MDESYNKHFIRTDIENRIIHGFTDAFEKPRPEDICNHPFGRLIPWSISLMICQNALLAILRKRWS